MVAQSPPPPLPPPMVPQAPHLVTDEVPLLLIVILAQEPGFVGGQVHRALGADRGVSPWVTLGRCPPKGTQSHGTARVSPPPSHPALWHGQGPRHWEALVGTGPHGWHRDSSATSTTRQLPATPNLPSADASFLSAPASSPANRSLLSPTAARSTEAVPGSPGRWASSGGDPGDRWCRMRSGAPVSPRTQTGRHGGNREWPRAAPAGNATPVGDATPGGRCHPGKAAPGQCR